MPRKYRVYCVTEAANIYTTVDTAPTVCPNNAGHTINANSIDVVDNDISGGHFFGDGSDGDVTVSTNTSLTRDMYYRNLTLTSAAVLSPSGFRIFVSDTLTFTSGQISANGGNGTAPTAGASPYTAQFYGTGNAGGNGATNASNGSSGGSAVLRSLGGAGGTGGDGTGAGPPHGGAGEAVTAPTAIDGGTGLFRSVNFALRGITINSQLQVNGGGGGGGGAGASSTNGGGGGAGGGIIVVAARTIVVTSGSITANGGTGGNPSGSSAGGGGGGGGGVVVVISTTDTTSFTITASGGAGGTSAGPGTNGIAGSAGNVYRILI